MLKVFRGFRDVKAVLRTGFDAPGAGPISRRIKGLGIFAPKTRASARARPTKFRASEPAERTLTHTRAPTYAAPHSVDEFPMKESATTLGQSRKRARRNQ